MKLTQQQEKVKAAVETLTRTPLSDQFGGHARFKRRGVKMSELREALGHKPGERHNLGRTVAAMVHKGALQIVEPPRALAMVQTFELPGTGGQP